LTKGLNGFTLLRDLDLRDFLDLDLTFVLVVLDLVLEALRLFRDLVLDFLDLRDFLDLSLSFFKFWELSNSLLSLVNLVLLLDFGRLVVNFLVALLLTDLDLPVLLDFTRGIPRYGQAMHLANLT
jgi:hypothetical protein